jgi:hypothetical protein
VTGRWGGGGGRLDIWFDVVDSGNGTVFELSFLGSRG